MLLTLTLPRGQIKCEARVVRAGDDGVSLQFVDLPGADGDRIVTAVFERLRRLPRVRGAQA